MLEKLLEALFKLSGRMAMPSDTIVQISLTEESTGRFTGSYVAPSDGWVYVHADAGIYNCNIRAVRTKTKIQTCVAVPITESQNSFWLGGYVPIRKGETAEIMVVRVSSTKPLCEFLPTVGSV